MSGVQQNMRFEVSNLGYFFLINSSVKFSNLWDFY